MKMYQLVSVAYLNQMEEALEKARKLLPDDQLQVTEPIVIRRHAAQDQAPVIYDSRFRIIYDFGYHWTLNLYCFNLRCCCYYGHVR